MNDIDFPIFSPSDVETWLTCPRLLRLNRDWRKRVEEDRGPWMEIGSAIHAGLATLYDGEPREHRITHDSADYPREAIANLIAAGLAKAEETDIIGDGILQRVEWPPRPNPYHAILDLLHEDVSGQLVVTDHKVKRKGERGKLDLYTRDYDPAWQTWHYAWMVWREMGRVPTIQYHLIFLEPRPWATLFVPATQPTEDGLERWENAARHVWERMEEERGWLPEAVTPNTRMCSNQFGKRCAMYEMCWGALNGRPHEAGVLYERRD